MKVKKIKTYQDIFDEIEFLESKGYTKEQAIEILKIKQLAMNNGWNEKMYEIWLDTFEATQSGNRRYLNTKSL